MKRITKKALLGLILLLAVMLCGCEFNEAKESLSLRIVDGAKTGMLILAGETDIFILNADDTAVYLDGEKADASALEDGMRIDLVHNGVIQETYPASFGRVHRIDAYSLGSAKNPGGTTYDLCGLYLKVLDDLWEKDTGLNDGASYVSVDLESAPGSLTSGEQAAIAWIFAGKHNAEPLTLSMDELIEEGYLTEIPLTYGGSGEALNREARKAYQWEDGLLFTITGKTAGTESFSLPVIQFDAMKWRTPLGAYYFSNCSAVWPQMGTWSDYNIEHEMIS